MKDVKGLYPKTPEQNHEDGELFCLSFIVTYKAISKVFISANTQSTPLIKKKFKFYEHNISIKNSNYWSALLNGLSPTWSLIYTRAAEHRP